MNEQGAFWVEWRAGPRVVPQVGGDDAVVQPLLAPHAVLGLGVQVQDGGGEGEGGAAGRTTPGDSEDVTVRALSRRFQLK